jgi:hypothetical protein
MENSREKNIREAIEKYGPITDRFILRLGKSDEEAGKFEPWHSGPETIEEDFKGFLACLSLTRLVDSVEERMKHQKGTIRAVKKEQRETAKAIAKEQEKLQKAIAKAETKKARDEEKIRIKDAAKLKREETKEAKKAGIKLGTLRGKYNGVWHQIIEAAALYTEVETFTDTGWEPIVVATEDLPEGIQPHVDGIFTGGSPCTSISKELQPLNVEKSMSLDSTLPTTESSMRNLPTPPQSMDQTQKTEPQEEYTSSTVETQRTSTEEETTLPYRLPMEG